jgi:RNA-directed DNA polymerase
MSEDAPVNIGAALVRPFAVHQRVLSMQIKLQRWAVTDGGRRFDDVFNLVADPCFLVAAWERVRENRGAKTAGVDRATVRSIEESADGAEGFLERLRAQLKARTFVPAPVRRVEIPKASGKVRKLGIPTIADRVVQASLKLVLEPIFEADFSASSYGFRPGRRAQDAIEAIRFNAHHGYGWVLEADIASCFDEIDHTALMGRVRGRISDKRVLGLVKAFLKAGVLEESAFVRDSVAGTPQGGILSPLLANIALSVLDDHFEAVWKTHTNDTARVRYRRRGGATYRLVRYADDFVVMVFGTREHAVAMQGEVADVLASMGLRLAPEKTQVVSIDEGFDFLGFHLQRHTQKGSQRSYVYSYPSKKSMISIRRRIKALTTRNNTYQSPGVLFHRLNRLTRGWAQYFRHGSSSAAYHDIGHYLWWRVWGWLRDKHPRTGRRELFRRYHVDRKPEYKGVRLYNPASMSIQRYRYRGNKIPTPWNSSTVPA